MGRIEIKLFVTTLLLISLCVNQMKGTHVSKTAIDELRQKYVTLDGDIWMKIINEQGNNIPHVKTGRRAIEVYKEFTEDLQQLMPNQISDGLRSLEQYRPWLSLYSEMRQTHTLYENFRKIVFLENSIPSPKEQWLDFAQTVTVDFANYKYLKNTLPMIITNINRYIKDYNIFKNVLQHVTFDYCDIGQSTDQVLYNLYNSIALIQLKGYMMAQFAFTMLTVNRKGYKYVAVRDNQREYKKSTIEIIDDVKEAMSLANKEIWKCDPKQHVKGETYTELTQLLQGYLENEVDMNPRSNCLQNCAYYDYTQSMGCYRGLCKKQRKCKGKVLKCQYIDSDMSVCEADKKSGRRYDYIEYDNDRVFGRNTGCSRGTTRVESWWRWLFWHCSYCICLCDEASPQSDRYFSLRPVVSDVSKNKIVTGIRFQKVDKVIHLQIHEAQLLPYGRVNATLNRWKPVDNFKTSDRSVRDAVDYHTMSYEKRDMDLDDLKVPDGYIVTGVKFRVVGPHLNLEIQATPFNFTTGMLIQPSLKSFWHSSDNTLERTQLKISNPDIPTRSPLLSKPDSKHDMYLEFANSDLERDVGQTTIPFIDTQDVKSEVLVPLSGVGIYHKGQPNFGGFVAPKIITYDFSKHLEPYVWPEIKPMPLPMET